jgi:hypothetical protein
MARLSVWIFYGQKRVGERAGMVVDEKTSDTSHAATPRHTPDEDISVFEEVYFATACEPPIDQGTGEKPAVDGKAGLTWIERFEGMEPIVIELVKEHVKNARANERGDE